MTSPRLNARVLKPEALSAGEIAAWDALCQGVPQFRSAFYSHAFALAASRAGYRVRVAVLHVGEDLVGFFPFQYSSRLAQAFGLAERVGEEMSDYFGVIADPTIRLDPSRLLKACGLNCCSFTHLDETQLKMGLQGEQPELGLRIELPDGSKGYWVDLAERDKKFVSDTERRMRKLGRDLGRIDFSFQSCTRDHDIDQLLAAKRAQYIRTKKVDWLSTFRREALVRLLVNSDTTSCTGVLSVLRAGDTWVAMHFGLQCQDVLHCWLPVYNPDLHAYAPGRLLLTCILQSADAHGIRAIDRGVGDTPAKRDFTNATHQFYRGLWSRNDAVRLIHRGMMIPKWGLPLPWRQAGRQAG